MSFQATPARTSRFKSARRPSIASALRRSTSSPSQASPRRKSSHAEAAPARDHEDERLDDTGVIASLAADLNFRDVPQYIEYIRGSMFSDIPDRSSGMNSTRIAEVLNFRRALPPIVTVAHIDALSPSSTKMEREIAELAQAGVLRRVTIPHRGIGAAAVGDGIASVLEWQRLVREHPGLDGALKTKYISLLDANPTSATISGLSFTSPEITSLTTAGFLTTAMAPDSRSSLFAAPGSGSLSALSSAGSRHAAGSIGAVGGADAGKHIAGGGTGRSSASVAHYNFSLPNTGSHIKLLSEARTHLLSLLKKMKHKEAPMDILCERWDGGVPAADEQTKAKRARGEFTGVLPGRTKKWKAFWGLRFEWIIEECVGSGLIEAFETGSPLISLVRCTHVHAIILQSTHSNRISPSAILSLTTSLVKYDTPAFSAHSFAAMLLVPFSLAPPYLNGSLSSLHFYPLACLVVFRVRGSVVGGGVMFDGVLDLAADIDEVDDI
ncbi:serine-threonine protein kinase 19-domain-containing protein [Lophiotrema nucula]|uniref:Serine-threonine protein kinase 19-domain-containing protein n=1 Tax=Lophiotrema nucula TaxID=690887 RepID=A0A6A5Z2M4_9PLEO|nr:serine-threonine protein kinase 19-domain-containing protein [Lophiotrema nucula]